MPRAKKSIVQHKRSLKAEGYYSDCHLEHSLYGLLIRSPASSGFVKSVTINELPEGYFLFTANDIPGEKKITLNKQSISIFGYGNIAYQGEPVGILVGPNKQILEELSTKVSVNFDIESLESALNNVMKSHKRPLVQLTEEPLESKNTPSNLLKNNSSESVQNPELEYFVSQINKLPSLDTVLDKKHIEQNVIKIIAQKEIKTGIFRDYDINSTLDSQITNENSDIENTEQAKTKSPIEELFNEEQYFVTEEEWVQDVLAPSWKETSGSFCYVEGKNLHVYAPSKWVSFMMNTISSCLNIPKENIFIHKTKTSGVYEKGFWRTSVLATQVALAAIKTRCPIKLILSQKEQEKFFSPGVKTKVKYKTSFTKKGEIKALFADILVDVGSLNPFAQDIVNRMVLLACNYYKIENVHISAKAILSKNPPTSICFKSIDSQMFFAIENHVQLICSQAKLLPSEFKKLNAQHGKKSLFPILIPNERALFTFDKCTQNSDFNRKYASYSLSAQNRTNNNNNNHFFALPLRGIGVATSFVSSNYHGSSSIFANPKIDITLFPDEKVVIHAVKPSAIIENIWKTKVSDILKIKKENISIDSDYELTEIPTSPEDFYGSITVLNDLITKACNEIQKKRFFNPLPIISRKTMPSSSKKTWNKETFEGNPFDNTSFATVVVEVDLDAYSFNEKIKGIWITADCGEIFDESAAIRTARLEIQQELSMLVKGKTVICDNINIEFLKTKNKSGQIGNLIHTALPAAFSAALSLALNTQLTKLPCTEKLLFSLIKGNEVKNKTDKNLEKGV